MESFGGAPQEVIDALAQEDVELEVEKDCWETVMLFMRVQTQWRYSFGGPSGLDYTAVFETMDRLRVSDAEGHIFEGLQVMEVAALRAMAEKG